MQNPLANFIGVFSLVRDVWGFQVNPLCRHDITSPFPPSGNGGYVRNLDDIKQIKTDLKTKVTLYIWGKVLGHITEFSCFNQTPV